MSDQEQGVTRAAVVILMSVVGLVFAILLLFSLIRDGGPGRSSVAFVVFIILAGLSLVEFGICVFSIHSLQLLPKNAPMRFFPWFASSVPAILQLLAATDGYATIGIIAFTFALLIIGWAMQRVSGACLSWNGEQAFQKALGTGDLLAIAPSLLLIGIVPLALTDMFLRGNTLGQSFGSQIVYYSIAMSLACITPLLFCYLTVLIVDGSAAVKTSVGVTFALLTFLAAGLEASMSRNRAMFSISCAGIVIAYCVGVAIAYGAFRVHGWQLVWAKRLVVQDKDIDVPFDQLEAD